MRALTLCSSLQVGIVHLQWEESSSVVSTCCLDGKLRLWDARSGSLVAEYHGHTAEILDFTVNRCSQTCLNIPLETLQCPHVQNLIVDSNFREASVAVTASGDSKAKVFCLQRPDR